MTPEYMYNEMTWAEVVDGLAYVQMYELNERHYAAKPYNRNTRVNDWYTRHEETPSNSMREFISKVRK